MIILQGSKLKKQTMFIVEEYKTNPALNGSYSNEDIEQILEDVEVTMLPLQNLVHNLALKDWQDSTGAWFSAQMFLNHPTKSEYSIHKRVVQQALPFQYPLYVWLDNDTNEYFLVDGMHRLVHLMQKASKIACKVRNQLVQAPVKILTDKHLSMLKSPLTRLALAARQFQSTKKRPILS
jgi:hypothetical protein